MLDGHHIIHVLDDALVDDRARPGMQRAQIGKVPRRVILRLVEGRHIDAVHVEQARQETAPPARTPRRVPRDEGVRDLENDFLAFSDDKEVEEVRDRLDIIDAWTAADDERRILAAHGRIEWDARKVEHIEHIGVDHLVLEGESEEVKCMDFPARFEGKERDALLPHLFLHIHPRRIDALGENVRAAVQYLVEDGKSEIAHADLVDVGEREREPARRRIPVLADGVPLAARIPRRL